MDPTNGKHGKLTLSKMEQWLWDAACAIRGGTDAPKFKDFILPLVFYKRLSDVFDDEFREQLEIWGANDYNLSPSAYIQVGEKATHRDLADILVDLGEARVARERADRELEAILAKLGLSDGGENPEVVSR